MLRITIITLFTFSFFHAFAYDMDKENVLNELQSIHQTIQTQTTTGQRLHIPTSGRRLLKKLVSLEQEHRPQHVIHDTNDSIGDIAESMASFCQAMDVERKVKQADVTSSEIHDLFHTHVPTSLFHSPKSGGKCVFLYPHGSIPSPTKSTPRRRQNISRLISGRPPIYVKKIAPLSPKDALKRSKRIQQKAAKKYEEGMKRIEKPIEYHHLTQNNVDTIIVLPKEIHKKYHRKLHQNLGKERSKINRTAFQKAKSHANRLEGLSRLIQWVQNYYPEELDKRTDDEFLNPTDPISEKKGQLIFPPLT